MFFSWRKWLKGPRKTIRKPVGMRPRLESLEDRLAPTGVTYTVINTNDAGVGSGASGDLRYCINQVNAGAGLGDTINFAIPGGGFQDIQVKSALPTITAPVTIDGTPLTGNPAQVIELDGTLLAGTPGVNGLTINAAHTTVRGLVIGNFTGNGIEIEKSAVTVVGDFIGTNSNGDNLGNGGFGVVIDSTMYNNIGAPDTQNATNHNFISRNKNGGIEIEGTGVETPQQNVVANNDIGAGDNLSDMTGNGGMGVYLTQGAWGNQIGVNVTVTVNPDGTRTTTTTGARNVIAGNAGVGVFIDRGAQGNQVAGNYIGIRDNGTRTGQVVGNQGYGVEIDGLSVFDTPGPQKNIIGGVSQAEQNVISGNTSAGVYIYGSATGNTVENNLIGTDTQGESGFDGKGNPSGNGGDGVLIESSSGNFIGVLGSPNVISANSGNGVSIIYGLSSNPSAPTGNVVDSNLIGTDAAGNDSANSLTNGKDGINLAGVDKTHLVNSTQITNNKIYYDPTETGQADIKTKFTSGTTIKGNDPHQHEPQTIPTAPDTNPPAPCVIIADSSGVALGNNDIQGYLVQDSSDVTMNGALSLTGDYVENGGTLTLQGASVSANNLDVSIGAVFSGDGAVNANVYNAGEVDTDASGSPLAVSGAYTQTAGVTNVVSASSLSVTGALDEQGGVLNLEGGSLTVNGGYTVESAASLVGDGQITGDVTNAGTVNANVGALAVVGAYTQTGGATNIASGDILSVTGLLDEKAGALNLNGGGLTAGGGYTVEAAASLAGDGQVAANVTTAGTVTPDQSGNALAVAGGYTQTGGVTNIWFNAVLSVTAALDEQGGLLNLVSGGPQVSLQVNGGYTVESAASFYGCGMIQANVTNNGTFQVGGDGTSSVSNLQIVGNFTETNTAVLDMALAGTTLYDTLSVSGATALAGTLNVQLFNGFAPYAGQWFELMPDMTSGQFAMVNAPTVNGVTLVPEYNAPGEGGFILLAVSGPSGPSGADRADGYERPQRPVLRQRPERPERPQRADGNQRPQRTQLIRRANGNHRPSGTDREDPVTTERPAPRNSRREASDFAQFSNSRPLSRFLPRLPFVVRPVLEPHRNPPRHARFLHRHPVQHVGAGHGPFRVRDEDELRTVQKLAQHVGEPADVGLVQGGVHLVEDAERTRLALEDRQQQGHGRHRLLAAAHQRNTPQFLARRPGHDLDAALQNVRLVLQ